MSGPALAGEIRSAMGFPAPTSVELIGWATGVVTHIQTSGLATFGTIASPHTISGLTGPVMAGLIQVNAGYPFVSPELILYCTAMTTYIMGTAIVTYTGPIPPPPPGFNVGGTISGMSGSALADVVATALGKGFTTTELINKCTAIVSHIENNAEVVSGVIS